MSKHEFRGTTIQESLHNALQYKNATQCNRLHSELEGHRSALKRSETRLMRLERTLQDLSDDIENDKESFDNDDVGKVINTAAALLAIIPAIRAVRAGIGAVRAGVSIVQAIRNGQTLDIRVAAVVGGAVGINLLSTPGPRRKMQSLLSDIRNEMVNVERLNIPVNLTLEAMKRLGCSNFV